MLQEMQGLSSNLHLNHLDLSDNWYIYTVSMCNVHIWTVCMGHSFTSKSQGLHSVCKIQARKCNIESLPLVAKKLLLDHMFALWK